MTKDKSQSDRLRAGNKQNQRCAIGITGRKDNTMTVRTINGKNIHDMTRDEIIEALLQSIGIDNSGNISWAMEQAFSCGWCLGENYGKEFYK